MVMTDLDIIKQLLNGNHLEDTDLEKASSLVHLLDMEVKRRIK